MHTPNSFSFLLAFASLVFATPVPESNAVTPAVPVDPGQAYVDLRDKIRAQEEEEVSQYDEFQN